MIIKIIVTITLLFALLWIYSSLKVSSSADEKIEKERAKMYRIRDKKSKIKIAEPGDYVRVVPGGDIFKVTSYIKEPSLIEVKDGFRNFIRLDVRCIYEASPYITDILCEGDLLYVDISPDKYGGIVVPRIAETKAELENFKNKIEKREWILRGVVPLGTLIHNEFRIERG